MTWVEVKGVAASPKTTIIICWVTTTGAGALSDQAPRGGSSRASAHRAVTCQPVSSHDGAECKHDKTLVLALS